MDLRLYGLDTSRKEVSAKLFSNLYDVKKYLAHHNARIELCVDMATAPLDPMLVVLGKVVYQGVEDYEERLCLRSLNADQLLEDLQDPLFMYAQELNEGYKKAQITRKSEGFF
jgi:hypothetical protein